MYKLLSMAGKAITDLKRDFDIKMGQLVDVLIGNGMTSLSWRWHFER